MYRAAHCMFDGGSVNVPRGTLHWPGQIRGAGIGLGRQRVRSGCTIPNRPPPAGVYFAGRAPRSIFTFPSAVW